MATTAASPSQSGNLRPLSLAQRPLQLRSNSSADLHLQQPSPAPTSSNVTPKPPVVDRQQKRYSTLSYASSNSPSPSANGGFTSPMQSPMITPLPGGLSRTSSRSGARGATSHRASMDVSSLNGIATKRPSSLYGSQPVTPATGIGGTPDLSSINDILAQDSSWIRRSSSDGQSPSGTEAHFGVTAVRTLADKHADLLQSIAQKEAKCLELRTQLAQQEADLKELKSQWTNIVQKSIPSSSAGGGSINLASAAVIREGMGRLFSNVTAPLASALDALDPMVSSPTEQPPTHDPNETSEVKARRTMAVRGHTPGSSSRSSASNSSFAASRPSISSASTCSRVGRTDSVSSLHLDDVKATSSSPLSRTDPEYFAASPADLASEADGRSKSVTPTPTESGDPTSANGALAWAAAIPGMDGLNKKWEEIQRGDTFVKGSKRASVILSDVSASFISSFAPPLNEPLRSQKPRLISRPAGAPPTSFNAPNPPPMPLRTPNTSSSSRSLLDDDDDEAHAQPVMVPSKPTPLSASGVSNVEKESPNSNTDDDEAWNW